MNFPTPSPCYQLSRTVMGEHLPMDNLRLEMDSDSFYLFSYHHLDFAKFDSDKGRDALTLSFLGHQVCIAGRNLRELAVAIQKRAVESIQTMPTRYSGAAGNAASFVESIEIQSDKTRKSDASDDEVRSRPFLTIRKDCSHP